MPFFQNARNVGINGGKFFAVKGDYNNISVGSGIQVLSQAVSHGAMHDSSERDPPPRCYPGTRKKVADDIIHWLEDPWTPTSVLWVNGRAGVGKSALMQTIAELLRDNNLDLGGCFFFQRNVSRCNRKGYLFSTLAYQLAINVVGMRGYINQAMEDNPALPTKSAAVQLQKLIVEPFMHLPTPRPSPVIIIDGLDECDDSDAQRDILSLISQVSTNPEITIRFIIASRPEYQITHMFNKEPLLKMARRLVLDEDYESLSDIMMYLRDGFIQIVARSNMDESQDPWPSDSQLETLAWRASGQFIYAATVLKFVGSDFCDPAEHLDIVLRPSPMQAVAFSELDRLYTQILSVYPDPEFLKSVLGVMTVFQGELMCAIPGTYSAFVADILGTGEGKIDMVLRTLQSLTAVEGAATAPDIASTVRLFQDVSFCHKSFVDFLTDETRSRQYFVDLDTFQSQVLRRAFALVIESIRSPLKPTISTQIGTWRQFEVIFRLDDNIDISISNAIRWLRPSSCTALHHSFKGLRSALSVVPLQQWDIPSPHVFPALYFACSALNVLRFHPRLPEVYETMDELFMDTRNFLDTCYRQALAASVLDTNSLIGHLALDFSRDSVVPYKSSLFVTSRPVINICKMWSIPSPSVQKFLSENSHFIRSEFYPPNLERYHGHMTVTYSAYHHLHQFVTNPFRAQHLYQHFWTLRVRKCHEAVRKVIQRVDHPGTQEGEFTHECYRLALGVREYFEQNYGITSSSAGILDLKGVENDAAHTTLQNFLEFLSEVPWAQAFLATEASTMLTFVITSWVCDYLESSIGVLNNPIRDAVELVYQAVLVNGILPKLHQQAIIMANIFNNDDTTLSLLLDWISALQKVTVCISNGVVEYAQLPDLDGPRMHLLFKNIARALLTHNLNSSFGSTSLEKLLLQRLKRLLLPAAGYPMRYWGMVDMSTLPRPPPKDGYLTWDALFFLCLDFLPADQSRFLDLE